MSKQPLVLPESDCVRLKKSEMASLKILLTMQSVATDVLEDLTERLGMVPRGRQRVASGVGLLKSALLDVIGTMPINQGRQLQGTMNDYKVQIVPKMTPLDRGNIVLSKDQAVALLEMAKEKCIDCTEDGYSCRKCELYKIMEATTPLDDYGNGMSCPYTLVKWR